MRLRKKSLGALSVAMLCLGSLAAPVNASMRATWKVQSGTSIVIDGVEYGPEDGLEIVNQEFVVEPGGEPVGINLGSTGGGNISPLAVWGSSYATSTETMQLYYTDRAKAAGNVYSGKRIIQVCFQYTRGGAAVSGNYCSNAVARSGYDWIPGPEVSHGVWDSLNPNAPKTIFNISTVRINP